MLERRNRSIPNHGITTVGQEGGQGNTRKGSSLHHDSRRFIQKRIFATLPKMPRSRKSGICVEGSPRRKCGNHSGGRSLAGKVLRQGYFWPSIQRDALDMVRRCKKCQEHANIMHVLAAPMQLNSQPLPFFISGVWT
ncbi:UNVERIFIED_CONTAM: hypothetical protein Sradi_3584800 [Sesamum radiatum]|uniref:Integrase zinc-binding domain-containing protein n=1 Tax=Sesamum radiatum TaxID=300843 RepID=A0AAW2QHM7_SESRA